MSREKYDLITVYRGKDSATYLASDFEKFGDEATPLWVRQHPGDNQPFHKIDLEHADGFYMHNRLTKDDIKAYTGEWDLKALQKLLSPAQRRGQGHDNQ